MDISTIWPYVLAIAPIVVGLGAFAKTLLEMRKLQLETLRFAERRRK